MSPVSVIFGYLRSLIAAFLRHMMQITREMFITEDN